MASPTTSNDNNDLPGFLHGGGAMAALVAAHDWAATTLGPLDAWPAALKTAASLVLNSSLPMSLLLGEDAIALYNDAYAELLGPRHPRLLGSRARDCWPEHAALTDQAVKATQRGERLTFRDMEVTILRNNGLEQAWMNIDISPVRDESGVWLGMLSATADMTERVLAQRRAVLQIDALRNMFDQAPGFICVIGAAPDHRILYLNEAHKRVFGDLDAVGRRVADLFPDVAELQQAYASGRRYLGRGDAIETPTPDGGCEVRYVDLVLEPLKDAAGQVNGVFVEGIDVTPLVRAQQAAEASARRLSAAVAVARLGAFELTENLEARLDARAREIFGFGPDEPVSVEALVGRMDPEDVARLAAEDAAALAAGRPQREADYRIRLPDGSVRHVRAAGDLIAGPDGAPYWSVGLVEDVTERRRAEQRQRLLINELNHRVKNTLATVQSIASQTLRSAPQPAEARAAFEARLVALSAAHDLLTAQSWRGARLDEVAATALAPFEAVQRPQVARSGPPVWLTASRALALSLPLHELAPNATKHGALAVPEGRVSLGWSLCGAELSFTWAEADGPPVTAPSRSGFGMRLLQRSLAHELGGAVTVDFAPGGVRCEIRFAVDDPERAAGAGASAADPAGRFWTPDLDGALRSSIPG